MPALLILAVISWLFGSGKPGAKANELPIFTALESRPHRRWNAFGASLVAHFIFVCLILIVSDIFSASDDEYHPRNSTGRAVVIRLPETFYVPPAARRPSPFPERRAEEQRVAIRRKDLRKYAERREAKFIESPSMMASAQQKLLSMMTPDLPPQPAPRKFELPDLPVRAAATQTLLEAEQPPDLPPQIDKRLPQLVLWGAGKMDLKPPAEPIKPGNLTARLQTPKLNSPPRLEAPNLESMPSDLRIASSTSAIQSIINLPPSTAMPIRMNDAAGNNSAAASSIDPLTGQPVHVIALSPDPAPLTDAFKSLLIPAGNQLARLPGASPFFGLPGLGDGTAGSRGMGLNGSADGTPEGREIASAGGPGGSGGDGLGLAVPPGFTGAPLRMIHPSNGVFDIVVVQSSAIGALPDGADMLSGRPIYTVYLQVGAPKEWILQYCIPNAAGPMQAGNIVELGNPEPVRAPYPMVTVRPPQDWRHGADYMLVHGFLDASGRFRDLQVLPGHEAGDAMASALLQFLGYWEFRPAVLDGRPVTVEVILAVPPDQAS